MLKFTAAKAGEGIQSLWEMTRLEEIPKELLRENLLYPYNPAT